MVHTTGGTSATQRRLRFWLVFQAPAMGRSGKEMERRLG